VDTLSYKTQSVNKNTVNKEWILVDAKGRHVGRLASQLAVILRGKHKPYFTPHVDCGDRIVVVNAGKVRLTGKKWAQKNYVSHTGYPGGQRSMTAEWLKNQFPTRILSHAVKGMLPKNRLGRKLFLNLFIYEGQTHAHEAQSPKPVVLNY
jgi:large subunit ribosomal protein L13